MPSNSSHPASRFLDLYAGESLCSSDEDVSKEGINLYMFCTYLKLSFCDRSLLY